MMTTPPNEQSAEQAIRDGRVTLAFDTNCIIGRRKRALVFGAFLKLATTVDQLRNLEPPHELKIVVPSPAHFEVLHDLRVDKGIRFDRRLVEEVLKSKGILIETFDAEEALAASGQLFDWYPTEVTWTTAKGSAKRATIDWLVATQASSRGWVLVTDDTGAEYTNVHMKIGRVQLRTVLDAILAERQAL
jgi:hypothetical protein